MTLMVLYPKQGDQVDEQTLDLDIIAVHGLNGDPIGTWKWQSTSPKAAQSLVSKLKGTSRRMDQAVETVWIRDLLPIDLPNARVMTFGFATNLSTKSATSTNMTDYAKDLLFEMKQKRRKNLQRQRPIILFAHSFGGLVVKQALVYACNDPEYTVIASSIIGIMFFATTHRGHGHVQEMGKMLGRSESLSRALQQDSDFITRMSSEVRPQLARYPIVNFYPVRETIISAKRSFKRRSSLVVNKLSATLDLPKEIHIPVDGDHIQICKISSRESVTYGQCIGEIKKMYANRSWMIPGEPNMNQYYMIPFAPVPGLVGYPDALTSLKDNCLPSNHSSEHTKCFVLHGVGGSGKTQLCLKFSQDYRERFWGIFWIDASTEARIQQSFFDLAQLLCLELNISVIKRQLSEISQPWLMIFDNADDVSVSLSKYFPESRAGSILINSRSLESCLYATVGFCEMSCLSQEAATKLLFKTASDTPNSHPSDVECAQDLANMLGCLPLALAQAGSYMKHTNSSPKEYAQRFQETRERLLKNISERRKSYPLSTDLSLCSTFEASINAMSRFTTESYMDALDLLKLFSFISPMFNAEELFKKVWTEVKRHEKQISAIIEQLRVLKDLNDTEWRPSRLRRALDTLASFAMVRQDLADGMVSIHPLLQSFVRGYLESEELMRYIRLTAAFLTFAAGGSPQHESSGFKEALLSHLLIFVDIHDRHCPSGDLGEDWANNLSSFSLAFHESEQYQKALDLEMRALRLRQDLLGAQHSETLQSLSRVGILLNMKGRFMEAATTFEKILEAQPIDTNFPNPETVTTMTYLATSYENSGRLEEAANLAEKALALKQQSFEEITVETSKLISLLASCYRGQGRYLDALKFEERVLRFRERTLGTEHFDTLITTNNLATTYAEIGDLDKAEGLLQGVVLAISKVRGEDHPDSLSARANLAAIHRQRGHREKAMDLDTRVVLSMTRVLGREHPDTQKAIASLAMDFQNDGRYLQSLELREELLRLAERVLGSEHPRTITTMSDTAKLHELMDQWTVASKLRRSLLQKATKVYGQEHPTTLRAMFDLVANFEKLDMFEEANELKKSTQDIHTRLLGSGLFVSEEVTSCISDIYSERHTLKQFSEPGSSSSEESILSKTPSRSSFTTIGDVPANLVERLAMTLADDTELLFAYEDLVLVMSERKFIRQNSRFLKQLLHWSHKRSMAQKQAVKFMQHQRQRSDVARSIYQRTSLNSVEALESVKARNETGKFQRLKGPDDLDTPYMTGLRDRLEKDKAANQDQSSDKFARNDESEDSEEDTRSDGAFHNDTNRIQMKAALAGGEDFRASDVDDFIHTVTDDPAYSQYKITMSECVQSLCSPQMLQSAMRTNIVHAVRGVLERHFDALAVDEYEWLHELVSLGYGLYEIAELLLDDMNKSPWVFSKLSEPYKVSVDPDFHTANCIHQGGKQLTEAPRLIKTKLESTEDVNKKIAEHCGLAGVLPKSRKNAEWTGAVVFEGELSSTASITYGTDNSPQKLLSRACGALRLFCGVVTYLQEKRLCCNTFTILRYTSTQGHDYVELRQVSFEAVRQLFIVLEILDRNWDSPGLVSRCLPQISEASIKVLQMVCEQRLSENELRINLQNSLAYATLAIQILTLGLYSYSQAHTGPLHPFFLTNALSQINLCGSQPLFHTAAQKPVRVARARLTCMTGVTGDFVNVFGLPEHLSIGVSEKAFDLLGSPMDIAETWDASRLIMDVTKLEEQYAYAIEIGEGFISSAEDDVDVGSADLLLGLHWTRGPRPETFKTSFNLRSKARIGGIAIHQRCPLDEIRTWLHANSAMETLGSRDSYWEASEAQVGMQGGQYVIAQVNMIWVKRPGITLKHIHLKPDINLSFLQSDWGLQISYCTGVAQRTPLCNLLADVTPILINELLQKPPRWSDLEANNSFVNALRGGDFESWFERQDPETQNDILRVVRYVLLVLQDTGVDHSGEFLIAVWPQKGNALGCFRIPCRDSTFWARILQDSPNCATFAYITPLCFETDDWKCQKRQTALWLNRSVVLHTAVSQHQQGAALISNWHLRHEQRYLIGQPGRYLVGRVKIPLSSTAVGISPLLNISKTKIPAFFHSRIKERLREKQHSSALAYGVVVATEQPTSLF